MNPNQILQQAVDAHLKGNVAEAEPLYERVLKTRPDAVVALHHLGVIRYHQGQSESAVSLISQALKLQPAFPEALSNLGLALTAQKKYEEALDCYRRSIALKPGSPETHNSMGSTYLEMERYEESIPCFNQALSLKPSFALAAYNMGVAYLRLRRNAEAIQAFQHAIVLYPPFPEAFCNLGLAYMAQGQRHEAVIAYRKAIELRPDFVEALNNLGQPLSELQMMEEATEAYRRAVALRPNYMEAAVNLAHTLRRRGMMEEAIEACRQGLIARPDNVKAQIEIINLRHQINDWSDYNSDSDKLRALYQYVEPFVFLSINSTPAEQLACAKNWAGKLQRGTPFSHNRARKPGRVRIGYLSCDYRRHATAYLMAEIFERHDRTKFEIFAYSYGYDDDSEIRKRVIASFDHFIDLRTLSNEDAAQRIYDDEIDILIDLKGYTGEARTDIIVNRPAPIQVNYVGYPGTMGADFIDYIIADSFVAPTEHAPFYTEQIVQLPHCYQPNDSKRAIATTLHTRAMHGLPEDAFVFCSFNGSYKITPDFFDVWMRLLNAVPNSVLWLLSTTPVVERNLRQHAADRGVDPQRIYFAQALDLPEHLVRHCLADLFLDTLPINAHTTASDSLWAGLPLITCAGNVFVGRVAGSTLRAVGLPELITHSLADYEALALDLATHPEKLQAVKQKLAANRMNAPLFDTTRYLRGLEAAYSRMAEIRASGAAPQPIVIEP